MNLSDGYAATKILPKNDGFRIENDGLTISLDKPLW